MYRTEDFIKLARSRSFCGMPNFLCLEVKRCGTDDPAMFVKGKKDVGMHFSKGLLSRSALRTDMARDDSFTTLIARIEALPGSL